MIKPGDIVRSLYGVTYDVMEYNRLANSYRLRRIGDDNNSEVVAVAEEVHFWDVFRKVKTD